jgi:hypothetical protein
MPAQGHGKDTGASHHRVYAPEYRIYSQAMLFKSSASPLNQSVSLSALGFCSRPQSAHSLLAPATPARRGGEHTSIAACKHPSAHTYIHHYVLARPNRSLQLHSMHQHAQQPQAAGLQACLPVSPPFTPRHRCRHTWPRSPPAPTPGPQSAPLGT